MEYVCVYIAVVSLYVILEVLRVVLPTSEWLADLPAKVCETPVQLPLAALKLSCRR